MAETRQEFECRMEAARLQPGDEEGLRALRRGWCLGSPEFKKQKLEELDGQVGTGISKEGNRLLVGWNFTGFVVF